VPELDPSAYDALTFDCFGTLVDWETGLARALRASLPGADATDDELLERYSDHEAAAERAPYRPYRDVMATAARGVAADLDQPLGDGGAAVAASLPSWPAFPDSTAAVRRLQQRYRLSPITNCDTELFLQAAATLGVQFDWMVTAEMAGAYKPDHRPFELAFETIPAPRRRILHVAQSLFHDHVPARELGLDSVWIDRRHGRQGRGATPEAAEVSPLATFPDMASFAEAMVPDD
jgi:2-haloalkanoic acid dehalogenase type II